MERLFITIVAESEVVSTVEALWEQFYDLKTPESRFESVFELQRFLQNAQGGFYCCIEHPYVDKLYRNEYYHYFSSKLYPYKRDCIRLSFFSAEVQAKDFREEARIPYLQEHFLGFLVLRPTFPAIIGRNVLTPRFFNNPPVAISSASFGVMVNGVKLQVCGFPHASQDQEMMVCAETTVWSIVEYFSHRYPEYRPIMPNEIHHVLNQLSPQRQAPSKGLNLSEISFALKQMGFGVRIYSRDFYGTEFENILKMYVESGIPVVASIENTTGIGHVVNIIGRQQLPYPNLPAPTGAFGNYYDLENDYVMIDDNHPAYRVAPLNEPAKHYPANWKGCTITNIIVPLYPKIYLEADGAWKLSQKMFTSLKPQISSAANRSYSLRTLLTSSRSFKHWVATKAGMQPDVREQLLNIATPKFVWLTEIITLSGLAAGKAAGLILLDATERNEKDFLAFYLEDTYLFAEDGSINAIEALPLQPFSLFYNLQTLQ